MSSGLRLSNRRLKAKSGNTCLIASIAVAPLLPTMSASWSRPSVFPCPRLIGTESANLTTTCGSNDVGIGPSPLCGGLRARLTELFMLISSRRYIHFQDVIQTAAMIMDATRETCTDRYTNSRGEPLVSAATHPTRLVSHPVTLPVI